MSNYWWDNVPPPTPEPIKMQPRRSKLYKDYILSWDRETETNAKIVSWDNDDILLFDTKEKALQFLQLIGVENV